MKTLHNYHQVWLQYGFTPEFYNIPQTETGTNRDNYPLRPELIESVMYLYRSTGDPYLLQVGVDILRSIQHSAKTPCGYATVNRMHNKKNLKSSLIFKIKDVRDHRKEDRMESFFLAETTKYLYLLFDSDNFIHNQGQHGTVIDTPDGKCIIYAGGYIFNTEAHPIDPGALHCCHEVPKQNLFDFSNLNSIKQELRGDYLQNRNSYNSKLQRKEIVEEIVDVENVEINILANSSTDILEDDFDDDEKKIDGEFQNLSVSEITTESTMKLDDNDSFNLKFNDIKNNTDLYQNPDINQITKFVPQVMLEKIRNKSSRYHKNDTWNSNYKLLSCKAQPFIHKLSIFGEFFNR